MIDYKDLPFPQIIFLSCPLSSHQGTQFVFPRSVALKLERASESGELVKIVSDSADLSRSPGVCISTCPQVMLLSREHTLGTTDAGDGLDGLIACGWGAAHKHPFID